MPTLSDTANTLMPVSCIGLYTSSALRRPRIFHSSLAQSVEHLTVNQGVVGSSPTGGAILIGQKYNLCQKALFYKAFSVFYAKKLGKEVINLAEETEEDKME